MIKAEQLMPDTKSYRDKSKNGQHRRQLERISVLQRLQDSKSTSGYNAKLH